MAAQPPSPLQRETTPPPAAPISVQAPAFLLGTEADPGRPCPPHPSPPTNLDHTWVTDDPLHPPPLACVWLAMSPPRPHLGEDQAELWPCSPTLLPVPDLAIRVSWSEASDPLKTTISLPPATTVFPGGRTAARD